VPPLPLLVDVLLFAVLPALGLAALVTAVLVWVGLPRSAASLGLLAGATLGLWLREALTLISGASAWNRLPWAALGALWIARMTRVTDLPASTVWVVRAAAAVAIAWLVIPAASRAEADWLSPVFAALVLAQWAVLERLAAQPSGGSVPACLAVIFLVAGGVLIHAGSARLSNAGLVLAAAFAGLALASGWFGADCGDAVPAAAVFLPGLLLMGQQETFSEVPWQAFALPALVPVLLAEALPVGQRPRVRLAVVVLTVLVPLVIALGLARAAGSLDFDV
jgi:hypothetical protein